MTFVITDPCIDTMDQSCVEVCPVDCIQFEEGVDRILYIDPVECIDCGACVPACPVNAIFVDSEVPADQARFTEINVLWFSDRVAARAQVGEDGAAPAEAPAAEAEQVAPAEQSEAPAAADSDAPTAETEAPAEPEATAEAAATPAPVEAEPEAAPALAQISAAGEATGPSAAPPLSSGSPLALAAIAVFALAFFTMWVFPGPRWLEIAGVEIGAGIVVLLPVAWISGMIFLRTQASALSGFAAHGDRELNTWRARGTMELRRSEESRAYMLAATVQAIARDRFAYPSEEHPGLTTHINLPEPQMALEFNGAKLFPDILVVEQPSNRPRQIVQIESRETVTRDQARYVWAALETKQAPLYIYVPAGLAARARDYANDASIKNYELRTWRWGPNGITVRELT